MPRKTTPPRCQPTKLSAGAIASEIGISTRQLARLAKKLANEGVPGVRRGPGGYQFLWFDTPEIREWMADRKRFRKGNRKRRGLRKVRFSRPQRFVRLIATIKKQVSVQLDAALERPTRAGLDALTVAVERLTGIRNEALNRIRCAVNNPYKVEDF